MCIIQKVTHLFLMAEEGEPYETHWTTSLYWYIFLLHLNQDIYFKGLFFKKWMQYNNDTIISIIAHIICNFGKV